MKISPVTTYKTSMKARFYRSNASNTISNYNYNPSFKSERLYKVALIKKNGIFKPKSIPAYFSKLDNETLDDKRVMYEIQRDNLYNDVYGNDIINSFLMPYSSKHDFYAIEVDDDSLDLKDRIVSIIRVEENDTEDEKDNDTIRVGLLQAVNKKPFSQNKKLKGAGEVCLYGIVKLANENKAKRVVIHSTNNNFYDHIHLGEKIVTPDGTFYEILNYEYSDFLSKTEQKYGF